MFARGLVGAGGKVLVAASAPPAVSHNNAFVGLGEIMHPFAGGLVVNKGAHGDFQDDGFAFTTGAVGAFPVASTLRGVFRIEAEMDQRVMAFA